MKDSFKNSQDFPEAFLNRMSGLLGSEYNDFLASLQLPAITGLRVNTLKISPEYFLPQSPFNLTAVPWCSSGFIIETQRGENSLSPGKHPFHNAGLYYLQEPSAMAAAEILAPCPGDKVLDLAAAPGGKATHLAALMNNTGLLVSNEIHLKRVWDLVENLERCGVTNSIIINETPQKIADHFGEYFDRVLLDAPCSGEGMFRKSEVARREWKPELVHSCAIRQAAILDQAARTVKPGGRLAYTTCTFSTEENETVIARFLALHPEFDLDMIQPVPGFQHAKPTWVDFPVDSKISRAIRIWPHLSQAEGHFIALLNKRESTDNHPRTDAKKSVKYPNRFSLSKSKQPVKSILDDFSRDSLCFSFDNSRIIMDGSYIYQLPEDFPHLGNLKVIHSGFWLGSIRKQRFTPSHSLAMGIKSNQVVNVLQLSVDDQRLSTYFSGETFPDSGGNGWVLVTVNGFPVGWGKRVQNMVKNYYPHGLRRLA